MYVIYSSLQASPNYGTECPGYASIDVGHVHKAVTIAYPPNALSTGHCYHTNWSPINYTELYYPKPDYEMVTERQCSFSLNPATVDSSYWLGGDPLLSLPSDLWRVDPAWSTCTVGTGYGGYDPPIVLTRARSLVPGPSTTPTIATSISPQPAAPVTNDLPIKTLATVQREHTVPQTGGSGNINAGVLLAATRTSDPLEIVTGSLVPVQLDPNDPDSHGTGAPPPVNHAALGSETIGTVPNHRAPTIVQHKAAVASPVIYEGAKIWPDAYSRYEIPGIGQLVPGGTPIIAEGVVYSMAPSATAIISNGEIIPIQPVSSLNGQDAENMWSKVNGSPAPELDFPSPVSIHDPKGGVLLPDSTLRPPPGFQTTLSGHIVNLDSGAIVVDSESHAWLRETGSSRTLEAAVPTALLPSNEEGSIASLIVFAFDEGPARTGSAVGSTDFGLPRIKVSGITDPGQPAHSSLVKSGQTLRSGYVITVSGSSILLSPDSASTVVGSVIQILTDNEVPTTLSSFASVTASRSETDSSKVVMNGPGTSQASMIPGSLPIASPIALRGSSVVGGKGEVQEIARTQELVRSKWLIVVTLKELQ